MATNTGLTERKGVNAVEEIFLNDFGWLFRDQPVLDFGIDAHVEVTEDGTPTGQLVGLQIKSGTSYFKYEREDAYTFHGEQRHLTYWTNHSLPIFLILHNPETQQTLWQRIESRLIREGKDGRWSIDVPKRNALSSEAAIYFKEGITRDEISFRRFMLAVDYPIMREVERRPVFLHVEEWVNKTLGFRDANLYFDEDRKDEADNQFGRWLPTHDIDEYMYQWFPWADYEYTQHIEDASGEMEVHALELSLNEIGQAFVRLEEFYQHGGTPKETEPPVDESELTEEEEIELWVRHAVEKDPYD